MSFKRLSIGSKGEKVAKYFLIDLGYAFIIQNYTTKIGEIDLIFQDGDQLVFVEVKTRSNSAKGLPEEAITVKKITHIRNTAQIFMSENQDLPQYGRVDALSIEGDQIRHIQNISQ